MLASVSVAMDISGAFRGSAAVACGAVTRNVLFGPRYERLFPDVYVDADLEVDLALRSWAATLATGGVASGWSAAELLDASCGPQDGPAEVTMPGGHYRRRQSGLIVHRDRLESEDVTAVDGVPVTSPLRTAFDLVRWRSLTEAVVAIDALAHRHKFRPEDLICMCRRESGARGVRKLAPAVQLADARAESPMETRIRLALRFAGLPAPDVQFPVIAGGRGFRLDMAYPSVRLGVEYDGRLHRSQERAMRDLGREALLTAEGWKILRFAAWMVLHQPRAVAAAVRYELRRRSTVPTNAS